MADLTGTHHNIWYRDQPFNVEVVGQDLETDTVRLYFKGALLDGASMLFFSIYDFEEMKEEYNKRQEKYSSSKSDHPTMVNEEMKQGYTKTRPKHYDTYGLQVLEMMEKIWGKQAVIDFCRLNSFKYRMRMGTKNNESFDDEYKKEQYYLEYAKKLEDRL